MARIRSVKPSLFTSLTVTRASIPARYTFVGLFTHVDDEGRCVYDPRLIKAALWPLDDAITADVVDAHIRELESIGSVVVYSLDDRWYLEIPAWKDHQRINRPTASKLPSYTSRKAHVRLTEDSRGEGKGKEGKGSGNIAPGEESPVAPDVSAAGSEAPALTSPADVKDITALIGKRMTPPTPPLQSIPPAHHRHREAG